MVRKEAQDKANGGDCRLPKYKQQLQGDALVCCQDNAYK